MKRVSRFSVALVVSLVLCLAVFTTGAFAQGLDRASDQSSISASAHAAVLKDVAQDATSGVRQRLTALSSRCGWGGCGWGWGGWGGWGGFGHGFVHCAMERICRVARECYVIRGESACHNLRICQYAQRCENFGGYGGYGDGYNDDWAVRARRW